MDMKNNFKTRKSKLAQFKLFPKLGVIIKITRLAVDRVKPWLTHIVCL